MSGRNKYDLAYHFIFGTKRKAPVLDDESLLSLQLLFSIKAKELGGELITSGGHKDHVHLLITLPPRISPSNAAKHIKGFSARAMPNLLWQRGYGVFSVDKKSIPNIKKYIENQFVHHGEIANSLRGRFKSTPK